MAEKQLGVPIKQIQSNWGGEYHSFLPFLSNEGILLGHPCPYEHQQNGRAE